MNDWLRRHPRIEAALFALVCVWAVFAMWCYMQNRARNDEARARCTCGTFEETHD